MSFRAWVFVATIGLIGGLVPEYGFGQVATEDQPGQVEGGATSGDSGENHQPDAVDLSPALKDIEAAIRDLIAEDDKVAREAAQDREKRDLQAQEEMALWAERMFYATFATVVLTFIALFGIIRTLHHTRRAADYTEGMLSEAKATTKAAIDAANQAERQAEFAEKTFRNIEVPRLYPRLKATDLYNRAKQRSALRYEIVNLGRTPAVITGLLEHLGLDLNASPMKQVYIVVPAGEKAEEEREVSVPFPVDREINASDTIFFRVQFTVLDPAGEPRIESWELVKDGNKPFCILNRATRQPD